MKRNSIFCITLVLAPLAFHNYPVRSLENKTVKVTSEMHEQSMPVLAAEKSCRAAGMGHEDAF